MDGTTRSRSRSWLVAALFLAAAVGAVLAVFGAADYKTTRVWGSDAGSATSGSTMTDGWGRWAGETMLCSVVALVALALSLSAGLDGRLGRGSAWAAVAASLLGLAAVVAGRYWLHVLDERAGECDYALTIARGLPIAAVAAAVGTVFALILTGTALLKRRSGSEFW